MIIVNFKTYKEATGNRAVELAAMCRRGAQEENIRIIAVPQLVDLKDCVAAGVECWVQHIDAVGQGKNTGRVTREAVEEAGATGTLLSHSEHKINEDALKWILEETAGMAFQTCVCAGDAQEARKAAGMKPNYILYEPPELVGSAEKSVSTEKQEVIGEVVKAAGAVPVLIGAGVKSAEDIRVGLKLGAKGAGLASNLVLAQDPEYVLRELVKGFK